jgi:hypothetical protein
MDDIARRLAGYPGMAVSYREFPKLGHGAMLPRSLSEGLKLLYTADSDRRG